MITAPLFVRAGARRKQPARSAPPSATSHPPHAVVGYLYCYWFLCSCETMSRCDPSQGLLWMYVCKMGTGFISRQNYTEKRLTLQSPCHHVVMPVRRTIITSVISILRMICKTQSPLYSIPGSVPRLLHIQNYIQTFRSGKTCQKMLRCRPVREIDLVG